MYRPCPWFVPIWLWRWKVRRESRRYVAKLPRVHLDILRSEGVAVLYPEGAITQEQADWFEEWMELAKRGHVL